MSQCYKCGRELPGAELECEPGECQRSAEAGGAATGSSASWQAPTGTLDVAQLNREQEELEAEIALAKELTAGHTAFNAAAEHLHRMGAGAMRGHIQIEGCQYLIFVKKL